MIVLGYWNIKGRLEETRLLMAYLNLEYKEENPKNVNEWFQKTKYSLDLDFPSLPYLIDNDFRLAQSQVIFNYLAEKYGNKDLFGKTQMDRIKVTEIKGVIQDIFVFVSQVCISNDSENQYKNGIQIAEKKLQYLCRYQNKKEFFMNYMTVVEFSFIVAIESLQKMQNHLKKESSIDKHESLVKHLQRLKNLPGIKEYYENNPKSKNNIFMHVLAKIKI